MHQRNLQIYSTCLLAMSLAACSSQLRLRSNPPAAKVELIQNDSLTPVLLGETPLELSKSQISEKQVAGPYIIRLSKDGFASREVIFAGVSALDADLNLELSQNINSAQVNNVIDQLFEAQSLAQKGDYTKSLTLLNELQKANNGISSVYEMRASIYMVRGDFAAAVSDLSQALAINPSDKNLRTLMDAAQSRLKGSTR